MTFWYYNDDRDKLTDLIMLLALAASIAAVGFFVASIV